MMLDLFAAFVVLSNVFERSAYELVALNDLLLNVQLLHVLLF